MLAVAKDKRYALSGPSPGALAVAKDRDNTKSKTESCALPGLAQSVLPGINKLRRLSPGALAVAKDKIYALSGPSPGSLAVA